MKNTALLLNVCYFSWAWDCCCIAYSIPAFLSRFFFVFLLAYMLFLPPVILCASLDCDSFLSLDFSLLLYGLNRYIEQQRFVYFYYGGATICINVQRRCTGWEERKANKYTAFQHCQLHSINRIQLCLCSSSSSSSFFCLFLLFRLAVDPHS